MIDINRLKLSLISHDINLDDDMLLKLKTYSKILVQYNEKVNLTALTKPEEIEKKHFLDSLLFAKQEEVKNSVADIGTGAGFPGVVAKIYKPNIDLFLIEPTKKRCDFLSFLLDELGIKATVINERAEDLTKMGYTEKFDITTARAVANLNVLLEYSIPLTKINGYFIAMKGDNKQEIENSKSTFAPLDIKLERIENYFLENEDKRSLIYYKKLKKTNSEYPRVFSKIKKTPL